MNKHTKWMLYGILTCLLIGAIVSTRLVHRTLNVERSSLMPATNKVPYESLEHEISSAKSSPVEAPQVTSDAMTKVPDSVQLAEPRTPVSREGDDQDSSSAEAIRALRPKVPVKIKSTITSDNTVEVRVRIDESGRVIGATPVSASGPIATSLVRCAVDAARRWRFRPARQNGKPVRSERVLEFLFRLSDNDE